MARKLRELASGQVDEGLVAARDGERRGHALQSHELGAPVLLGDDLAPAIG